MKIRIDVGTCVSKIYFYEGKVCQMNKFPTAALIGEEVMKVGKLDSALLFKIFQSIQSRVLTHIDNVIEKIYITYPIDYSIEERKTLRGVVEEVVGLEVVEFVDDPTWQVMEARKKFKLKNGELCLVCDLGAGSFKASLTEVLEDNVRIIKHEKLILELENDGQAIDKKEVFDNELEVILDDYIAECEYILAYEGISVNKLSAIILSGGFAKNSIARSRILKYSHRIKVIEQEDLMERRLNNVKKVEQEKPVHTKAEQQKQEGDKFAKDVQDIIDSQMQMINQVQSRMALIRQQKAEEDRAQKIKKQKEELEKILGDIRRMK